jgi:chromosome segregation ATPase
MSSSEMTSKQQKLEEAMKQTKELQDIRVKMEADLYELRSEKTQILEHNALLVESCDPEKYSKLKKEMVSLQRKLSEREEEIVKLNESLQFHQERNVEFKDQLEAALNEDTLQQIQEKISKYKKERDNCKEQMKQMKVENEEKLRHISHLEKTVASLMKELEGKEDDLVKLIKKVDEYKAKKLKYQEMVKQLLQERELRKAPQDVIDDTTSLTEPIMIPPLSITNPNPSSSLSLMSLDSKVKKKNSKSVATDGMTNEVLVRTSSGALQLRIRKQQDYNVEIGTDVVIKRSGGVYELGTLRYIGTSKGENTLCGVELHIPRADDSSGKDNDGTYRNGTRYFVCDKGHGLYTTLNNVYNIIT